MADTFVDGIRLSGFDGQSAGDGVVLLGTKVDNTLKKAGQAADAKEVGDALADVDDKLTEVGKDLSRIDSEGTVPTSGQMLSDNYTEDSVPYHFRKTASDTADREELEIVGGSVAWNQAIPNGKGDDVGSWTGIRSILATDGNSITATCTTEGFVTLVRTIAKQDVNHKYFVTATIKPSIASVVIDVSLSSQSIANNKVMSSTFDTANTWRTISTIGVLTTDDASQFRIGLTLTVDDTVSIKNVMVIDLTAMFGSTIADHIYSLEQTTAGAGVALFKSLFPKDYYAYDAGSMQSVSGLSEHKTVGFNAWDEVWEAGTYTNNGEKASASDQIRCKNPVHVFPNTSYYFKASAGNRIVFFGSDGTKVGSVLFDKQNSVITTPVNAKYLVFNMAIAYGTAYKNDICINLSDPAKNGTYEPYESHSYALDDSLTLRGIPTLVDGKIKWDGDVYSADGTVNRNVIEDDLSQLTWTTRSTGSVNKVLSADLSKKYVGYPANSFKGMISDKYTINGGISGAGAITADTSAVGIYYYSNSINPNIKAIYVVVPVGETPSGKLVFITSEPTTEQADPYVSPQICHADGTEEFVSTGIVPVGHVTKYPDNLRMKLDNLPWNFARLIAPVEKTFKATQNYDTGRRLIINNVLYIATANIANGANIVVGSNVRETNVDELLAELAQ